MALRAARHAAHRRFWASIIRRLPSGLMRRRLARAATASAEAAEASASAGVAAAIDMPFLSAQRLRAASAIRARASGLRRRRPPRRPRTARAGGAGAGVGSVGATAAPVSRRCNSFSRDSICSLIATARRSCSLDKLASAAFMNSVNTVLVRFGKQESERKAPLANPTLPQRNPWAETPPCRTTILAQPKRFTPQTCNPRVATS